MFKGKHAATTPALVVACLSAACATGPASEQLPVDIIHAPVAGSDVNGHALGQSSNADSLAMYIVARDMVDVLTQIDAISTENLRLRMTAPQDAFGEALQSSLEEAGYRIGIKRNPDKTNLSYESWPAESADDDGPSDAMTYVISMADVKLMRDYTLEGYRTRPISPMFTKGVHAASLDISDENNFPATTPANDIHGSGSEPASKVTSPGPANLDSTSRDRDLTIVAEQPADGQYFRAGDVINLTVSSNTDALVDCYYEDGAGNVAKLFPNRFSPSRVLAAGESLEIPGTDQWQLTATRARATDRFLCLAYEPEKAEALAGLTDSPDLEPLPDADLDEIGRQYQALLGDQLASGQYHIDVNP
ncbi:MAG: hypothetical protein CSA54_00770 [Gammaproteobacteria bacterium]|nr:MAG: hypothetical protein CSA54_00770 [Gammaproteobacteria bacterium]